MRVTLELLNRWFAIEHFMGIFNCVSCCFWVHASELLAFVSQSWWSGTFHSCQWYFLLWEVQCLAVWWWRLVHCRQSKVMELLLFKDCLWELTRWILGWCRGHHDLNGLLLHLILLDSAQLAISGLGWFPRHRWHLFNHWPALIANVFTCF